MELDPYEEKLQIVSVFDLMVMSQQTHPDTEGLFANLQSENGFFTFSTIYIYIYFYYFELKTKPLLTLLLTLALESSCAPLLSSDGLSIQIFI